LLTFWVRIEHGLPNNQTSFPKINVLMRRVGIGSVQTAYVMRCFGLERQRPMDAGHGCSNGISVGDRGMRLLGDLVGIFRFPIVSVVCKEANQLTRYRGPFSSFCLRQLISRESADSREPL
jgi:hypothetical protein